MGLCYVSQIPIQRADVINPQVLPLITVAVDVDCFDNDEVKIPPSAAGVYRYLIVRDEKPSYYVTQISNVSMCICICNFYTYLHTTFMKLCICIYLSSIYSSSAHCCSCLHLRSLHGNPVGMAPSPIGKRRTTRRV